MKKKKKKIKVRLLVKEYQRQNSPSYFSFQFTLRSIKSEKHSSDFLKEMFRVRVENSPAWREQKLPVLCNDGVYGSASGSERVNMENEIQQETVTLYVLAVSSWWAEICQLIQAEGVRPFSTWSPIFSTCSVWIKNCIHHSFIITRSRIDW